MEKVKVQQTNLLQQYQKKVASIYWERTKICDEISKVAKQKHILGAQTKSKQISQTKNKQANNQFQKLDISRKLIKTDESAVKKQSNERYQSRSSVKIQQSQQLKQKNQTNNLLQEAKNQKSTANNSATIQRNRRVFGGLNTYLKKAGAQLQSKQQKQKLDTVKQILNKVIQKQKQQKLEQQLIKQQQLESKIQSLNSLKKENQEKLNIAQNQLLCFIVKSHYNAVGNFYLTQTQPKICWRPKKDLQDQQKGNKIKQQGQIYLKEIEQAAKEKINSYNEHFTYNRFLQYFNQNQKQYYKNYIKNMYIDHKDNIRTKAEPFIYWRPKKYNQKLLKFKQQTLKALNQQQNVLKVANSSWYDNCQKTNNIGPNKINQLMYSHQMQQDEDKDIEQQHKKQTFL